MFAQLYQGFGSSPMFGMVYSNVWNKGMKNQ